MPAIEARGFGFRHPSRPEPALRSIDLTVEPGERILLTGDSGSGKSTLLAAIAGLDEGYRSGTLEVTGTVGMVLQDPDSQVIATRIGDDVAFGVENMGAPREEIWPRVHRALEQIGLDLPLDHPTQQLSGGQKQRLALASVLAMGADIILLDEPTANLDPEGRVSVVDTVARLAGKTVIVAEHRAKHWLPHVDSIVRIDDNTAHSADALPPDPVVPESRPAPSGADWAVRTRDLQARWGAPHTLELPRAHSTVITGRNGAGKSTLLMALAGLAEPVSGTLDYSEDIRAGLKGPSWKWKSSKLASRVGMVFQNPEHQFVGGTVRQEMLVGGGDPGRVDELLVRLRLDHLRGVNPFTLSGGEKRRLSVATALVKAPRLLLLDEPTYGQDEHTFVELVTLLRELADSGVTVVSVTHDELYRRALGDAEVRL